MTLAITSPPGVIILSCEYDPTGLVWCRLYDNEALGWLVDETSAVAPAIGGTIDGKAPPQVTNQHRPVPIIVGSLAVPAPDTSPILSPQWCQYVDLGVFIPDLTRLPLQEFLTLLATNNGANRKLQRHFALSQGLHTEFARWAQANPDMVFEGDTP